jgi:hypothetical protein
MSDGSDEGPRVNVATCILATVRFSDSRLFPCLPALLRYYE